MVCGRMRGVCSCVQWPPTPGRQGRVEGISESKDGGTIWDIHGPAVLIKQPKGTHFFTAEDSWPM